MCIINRKFSPFATKFWFSHIQNAIDTNRAFNFVILFTDILFIKKNLSLFTTIICIIIHLIKYPEIVGFILLQ